MLLIKTVITYQCLILVVFGLALKYVVNFPLTLSKL